MSEKLFDVLNIIFDYRESFKECDFIELNQLLMDVKNTKPVYDDKVHKEMERKVFLYKSRLNSMNKELDKYYTMEMRHNHLIQICKHRMESANIKYPDDDELIC